MAQCYFLIEPFLLARMLAASSKPYVLLICQQV
jgi:hypothetical protein